MSKFKKTNKVLIEKKTGSKLPIFSFNGELGVKSKDFFGVTSCNDPMVYMEQIVLENFDIVEVNINE